MRLSETFKAVFDVDHDVACACVAPLGTQSDLLLNAGGGLLEADKSRPAVAVFGYRRLSCDSLNVRDLDSCDSDLVGCELTGRWFVELDGRMRIVPAGAIFAKDMQNQAKRGFDVMREGLRFGGEVNKLRASNKMVISLNLTPALRFDPAFVNNFLEACCRYQVDPNDVVLEILETDELTYDTVLPLRTLAECGVRFALDDFNSGIPLTNLHFLAARNVLAHCIKIDGKDTRRIARDRSCWPEMKDLLKLASAVGVKVIVFEGLPEGLTMADIRGVRNFMMERENLCWETKLFQGAVLDK